jgi:hypothetical protein
MRSTRKIVGACSILVIHTHSDPHPNYAGPEDRIIAELPTSTNCLVTNLGLEMALVYCKAVTQATNSQVGIF